jgi:NAD-dependent SIR2 family protein deacetylase
VTPSWAWMTIRRYWYNEYPLKALASSQLISTQIEIQMNVPPCEHCGGIIKLDVVMFGDNVPSATVFTAYAAVSICDSLLWCVHHGKCPP